ncbi:ABC transporter permease [Kribbella sp. NBC_01245]|uniref:ABC transporter permease n=1 Tax=Kribbella sp. NBC_01245 TaxID=2903578 RepID=UPI002E2A5BD9|nr:ABC transporter permease subunit [Kribbella sp. NBC_01245]
MTATIARLTYSTLFGHRRGLLMFILPGVMLGLALLLRLTVDDSASFSTDLLQQLALAVILPLVALVAGTGAIATEIDDGSIVYLLSKPIKRHTIVLTKAVVAFACIAVFGALPTLLSGVILGASFKVSLAFAIGALVAGAAYTSIFLALSVMTGNAVTIGLLYALLWESVMGSYVPGARTLSVQQWGLSVVDKLAGDNVVEPSVKLPLALILLVVVTVLGLALAVSRLRSLTLSSAE